MKIRNGFVSNSSSCSFTINNPFCVKVMCRSSSNEGQDRIDWCKENDMDFTTMVIRGIAIGEQIFLEDDIKKNGGTITISGIKQKVEMSSIMEIGCIFAFDLEQDARAFNDYFKTFISKPHCVSIYKPNTYRSSKKQGRTWHAMLYGENDPNRRNDIVEWLTENIKGSYVVTKKNVYFESNDDALHYKMVWWEC